MDGKRSRVGGKLRVTTSTPDNRDEARAQMSFAETEGIDPYDKNIQVAAARGLPKSWGEIAAGHLVIAQASLEYGWWEAVVLARNGDTFTLQYRDYPHLAKFFRHVSRLGANLQGRRRGLPASPFENPRYLLEAVQPSR